MVIPGQSPGDPCHNSWITLLVHSGTPVHGSPASSMAHKGFTHHCTPLCFGLWEIWCDLHTEDMGSYTLAYIMQMRCTPVVSGRLVTWLSVGPRLGTQLLLSAVLHLASSLTPLHNAWEMPTIVQLSKEFRSGSGMKSQPLPLSPNLTSSHNNDDANTWTW